MIPVTPQAEPPGFCAAVRLKGQGAHLDPLHIVDGWFQLDPILGEVIPDPALLEADPDLYAAIDHTIETLHLNATPFVTDRRTYIEWCGEPEYAACVRELAPFVHREAVRQGWMVAETPRAETGAR